jgi:hypothetical protein
MSGITATPYHDQATVESCFKVYDMNNTIESRELPRSGPMWEPDEYLTNIFGNEILDSMLTIGITSGGTDYLDQVQPEDFIDAKENYVHMAKGMDPFKRHFVTFGIQLTKTNCENATECKSERHIYTLFRRYTSSRSHWVMCKSHHSSSRGFTVDHLFDCHTTATSETGRILKQLVTVHAIHPDIETELSCEIYDRDKNAYVVETYKVKLCCPATNK